MILITVPYLTGSGLVTIIRLDRHTKNTISIPLQHQITRQQLQRSRFKVTGDRPHNDRKAMRSINNYATPTIGNVLFILCDRLLDIGFSMGLSDGILLDSGRRGSRVIKHLDNLLTLTLQVRIHSNVVRFSAPILTYNEYINI